MLLLLPVWPWGSSTILRRAPCRMSSSPTADGRPPGRTSTR